MRRFFMIQFRRNKINFVLFLIGIGLFFMSGTFYIMSLFKAYNLVLLIAGIGLIWVSNDFIVFDTKMFLEKRPKVLIVLYLFFSISLLISFLHTREFDILFTIAGLFLIIWCSAFLIPCYCKRTFH